MSSTKQINWHPSWTKTGPNTYRQPHGFQEVLYQAIAVPPGSPGLFLVGSSVTFRYAPAGSEKQLSAVEVASLLRNAWLQIRQEYPTLAAENTPDGKVYHSPSSRAELESWLDSTFIVVPNKTWPDIWKNLVKTKHMTLYFFPEARQLFVQGEHHLVDGRGGLNFWDRFFRALASPAPDAVLTQTTGAEVALLPPRSDDLLDMAERSPGRGQHHAIELLAPLSAVDAPIFLPMPSPVPPHSIENATAELKADMPTSNAIKAACKAHKVSVTAAWHAAVVLATQSIQARSTAATAVTGPSSKPGKEFICFGNFDLRRYFPDPATVLPAAAVPNAYVINNHHCILPYVVAPEGKTFAGIARELDLFYQRDLSAADPDLWSALGPMIRMMVPEYVSAPEQAGSTPALSSLGVADWFIGGDYGPWKVDDLWFGNTVTGPWLECFMWTWKGRVCLNSCFNPAYYTARDVREFHEAVLGAMLKGLGVERGKL